jgi:hypothetical protein
MHTDEQAFTYNTVFAYLQHPFVTGEYWESHPLCTSVMVSIRYIIQNLYSFDNLSHTSILVTSGIGKQYGNAWDES